MLSLSRKTEYGLMALSHLSSLPPDRLANVGEIAATAKIPRELLAKILSEMVKAGLATSYTGPSGGFCLSRPLSDISLAQVMTVLENRPLMVACAAEPGSCERSHSCNICQPLTKVHRRVAKLLEDTPLSDLVSAKASLQTISVDNNDLQTEDLRK